jgi:GT2 family glycosyltransferase
MGRPDVAVVILSWNRAGDTLECLRSLARLEYPDLAVTVVDNASTDGSPALLRAHFPDLDLVENERNLGFAAGNNVGIARALDRGADYVFLLNNDTEVAPGMLGALVDVAESDPAIGMVGPKILYYDPPDLVWSAGGVVDGRGRAAHPGADQPDDDTPASPRDVDYVTGCGLLVKRAVIEAVGAFDERFFAYFEETEWCARARRAGFRVVYAPSARMWHKIQPGARAHSRLYLYLMARNRLLYLRCGGARPWTIGAATLDLLRTAVSWWLRPRHQEMRPFASALVGGVGAFVLGRYGAPPARP